MSIFNNLYLFSFHWSTRNDYTSGGVFFSKFIGLFCVKIPLRNSNSISSSKIISYKLSFVKVSTHFMPEINFNAS